MANVIVPHGHHQEAYRRQLMQTLGAAALAGPILTHTPLWGQSACAVLGSPSLTEGPYFVDEDMNRRDIRVDPIDGSIQAGIPLSLAINVSQITTTSCPVSDPRLKRLLCVLDVVDQKSVGSESLGYCLLCTFT